MMPPKLLAPAPLALALLGFALLSACASTPAATVDVAAEQIPAPLAEAERDFQSYLRAHRLPTGGESHNLQQVMQEKFSAFEPVRAAFGRALTDERPALAGFAAYRIGQLYLNFACEVEAIEPLEALEEDQKEEFRAGMRDQAAPLVVRALDAMKRAQVQDSTPWSARAAEVVAALSVADDSGRSLPAQCAATTRHWQAPE
ncbi:MAG: hypothetical protein H0U74_23100 [Bradymonadaceae bacterium]|nr:hypothetical protein [Lujinxingiaceae bacterium]